MPKSKATPRSQGAKKPKNSRPAVQSPRQSVPARQRAKPGPSSWPASHLIDERIRSLGDWRGEILAEVRRLIHEADPEITEECKWVKPTNPWGVPVWSHAGIICTGETYKEVVKLTFARGAALKDPSGLFNASLEGGTRRAIDLRAGDILDEQAFQALIRAAVAENLRLKSPAKTRAKASPAAKSVTPAAGGTRPVKLLSGGNPQIPKGYGDAPVQAYLAAIPGWKQDLGRRLDALITRTLPGVLKAVKWNSPFYGMEADRWFLSFHCFAKYIKVGFFRGKSLQPMPPGESKQKEVRYLDIDEDDELDEKQFADWVRQASRLPGERM